jgi:hypothetical protein
MGCEFGDFPLFKYNAKPGRVGNNVAHHYGKTSKHPFPKST